MSITSVVTNYVKFSGDQESELAFTTSDQEDSPAMQQLINLAAGNNTVTVPVVAEFTVHGVLINPPELNTMEPVFKGVAGDTGVPISAIHATVIQFGLAAPLSFVLENTTVDEVAGFRLIWF